MKSTIQNIFLAAAGLALGATSSMSAEWPPAKGDLVLGVQAISGTGSTTNVFLNLGPAHILRDATEGTLFANVNEELAAAFGNDWATRSDLYFGAIANRSNAPTSGLGSVPPENGDPSRTIYASRGTSAPGGASPWTGFVTSALGIAATELGGFIEAIDNIAGENGVMTLSQAANPVEWHNSWSKLNPVPGTAFSIFTGGIQRAFANEGVSQPKMLDIYRIQGDDGVGSYVTTIYLTDEGNVLAGGAFFTLNTSVDPAEGGSVDGAGTYPEGGSAELTAIPAEGYGFTGWSGDATGTDNPLTVTVNADMTITASFAQIAVITGPSITSVTDSAATLGGNVSSTGAGTFVERGIVYAPHSVNDDPLLDGTDVVKLTADGETGVFTVNASGLDAATTYAVKAFVTTSAGTTYTDVAVFTTNTILTLTGNTGSVTGQSIQPGDGQDYLFTLADAREVLLSGGATGLNAELFDANGNLIASGSGIFSFSRALPAGTYRLRMSNPTENPETFSFTVDATRTAAAQPALTVTPGRLVSKKAKVVRARAQIRNVGNLPSPLTVSAAPRKNAFFKVVYTGPGGNLTAALNAGRYQTPTLSSASAPVTITAKITPNKKKLVKRAKGKKPRIVKKAYRGTFRASAPGAATAAGSFRVNVR